MIEKPTQERIMYRFVFLFLFLSMFTRSATAFECPPPMPGCKWVPFSDQEIQLLTQPNGLFETAEWAKKMEYQGAAKHFQDRFKIAIPGDKPREPPIPQ